MFKVPYSLEVCNMMYAMVCKKPDIAHAVGRYMNNLGKEHQKVVKWILRYLRGTYTYALYFRGSYPTLQGYFDEEMEGNKASKRKTHGIPLLQVEHQ